MNTHITTPVVSARSRQIVKWARVGAIGFLAIAITMFLTAFFTPQKGQVSAGLPPAFYVAISALTVSLILLEVWGFLQLRIDETPSAETSQLLKTTYGLPHTVAKTLATALFADPSNRQIQSTSQTTSATSALANSDGTITEYRLLTAEGSNELKLQTRDSSTDWTDATPLTTN